MSSVIPFNLIQAPHHIIRRWLIQPLSLIVFFFSPLLNLFRIDVVELKLIFLRHVYPFAFEHYKWIPIVFFAGVLSIAIISTVGGRLFCGWTCPHNALTENTRLIRKLIGLETKSWRQQKLENQHKIFQFINPIVSLLMAIAITYTMSTLLIFYFISPAFWLKQYTGQGEDFIIVVFSQGLFTLIGLFLVYVGHGFCRITCPYGLAQSLMAYVSAKLAPMEIRMKDAHTVSECGSCKGCQTACPVDLDPREFITAGAKLGAFDGCFNCGDCIDACNNIQHLKKSDQKSFLKFQFNPKRLIQTLPTEKL